VLNVSILVAAHCQLRVPVSCVEAGRWGYRSRQFSSSGWASHGHLRKQMSRDALDGYRTGQGPSSKQSEVWREVDRKLYKLGSCSPSSALDQAYEDYAKRLDELLGQVRVPQDCQGVVYAFGGQVAGVDLFDQPATLQKLLPKLARAFALDVLECETDGQLDRTAVTEWPRHAPEAHFEQYDSPGLGEDVRLDSPAVVGAGLVFENCPVHVELFPGDVDGLGRTVPPPAPVRPTPPQPAPVPVTSPSQQPAPPAQPSGVLALATSEAALAASAVTTTRLEAVFRSTGVSLGRSGLLVRVRNDELDRFDASNPVLSHAEEAELVRRVVERAPCAQQRLVLTGCGLADNWFSHWHAGSRTTVVSLYDWQRVSSLPAAAFVAYQFVLHGWRAVCPTYDPYRLLHEQTRGCLFDVCRDKTAVEAKLRAGVLCWRCRWKLRRAGVSTGPLREALAAVRKLAAGQA